MRGLLMATVVVTMLLEVRSTSGSDGGKQEKEEFPPRQFLDQWAAAWKTGDADKMMAFYDQAKQTTAVESLGRIRRGPGQIRKMYDVAFDELEFDRVTLTPVVQQHLGDAAWGTYRYRAEMRLKSDERPLVMEVLGTFVLTKRKSGWKIAMEHFSTISGVPRVSPAKK